MNIGFRLSLALLIATQIALTGCGTGSSEAPPLAGAKLGGPFTLTDQDGKRVSDAQFAGRYRLMYFGYTFCPDVCPVDVQKLMQGFRLLERDQPAKAAKLQPIFITVDPARDTPAALKQFVRSFHPRLIGLTGSDAEIAAVAREYGISYEKREGATPGTYLMDHVRSTILYGPDGKPIAIVAQDGTPEQIAAELGKWVS